jgi:indole-3-glycerol phosphate synthase
LQTAANPRFLAALQQKRGSAIIAEIKMGSPRLGSLEGRFEPIETARKYAEGGAACLSVVVEPDFFFGSYELLAACAEASGLPAIAKDFIVDPLQLRWARRAGASAILLIAALYDATELRQWADLARQYGLVPLIEIHDFFDLTKLDGAVWELVGVNNRDLRTMTVELSHSLAVVHSLPSSALKISESGLADASDLRTLRSVGYDGFLIGESLLTAPDPLAKLRELVG